MIDPLADFEFNSAWSLTTLVVSVWLWSTPPYCQCHNNDPSMNGPSLPDRVHLNPCKTIVYFVPLPNDLPGRLTLLGCCDHNQQIKALMSEQYPCTLLPSSCVHVLSMSKWSHWLEYEFSQGYGTCSHNEQPSLVIIVVHPYLLYVTA